MFVLPRNTAPSALSRLLVVAADHLPSQVAGALLIGLSVPAYTKVAESDWNTQDTRTALLARLKRLLGR